MLRHIVLLTLSEDAPEGRVDEIVAAIRSLPAQIPAIRACDVGPDLGLAAGGASLGITMLFDDEVGWRAYQEHPAHQAVIADLIRPVLASRAAIQLLV